MIKIENLEQKKYWIWFSLLKIGSRKKLKLLAKEQTPKRIYTLKKEQLLEIEGIGEETVKQILNEEKRREIEKHINYMQKKQIDIITIQNQEYPQILKQIYDPPVALYIKGNRKILNQTSLGIVGCREASTYGIKATKYFAYQLAKQGIHIISGLAKGVDSYAHLGTIYANQEENDSQGEGLSTTGKTIAVLGCGLDTIYPQENKKIAEEILKTGGCIISEYPLGTKPEKKNFPARNRIISGISQGILVIEAKEKSGTLITVDFALEQGKEVFVVPGNINSIYSVGTNHLIKQGARVVTHARDVIEVLK